MIDRKLEVFNDTNEVIGLRYEVINSGVPIGMVIGVTIAMSTMIGFICGYTAKKLSDDTITECDTNKSKNGF